MAYAKIHIVNTKTDANKTIPVGFSWTVLFFGLFPALLRGHLIGALMIFLVNITFFISVTLFMAAMRAEYGLSLGNNYFLFLPNFIFAFFYNKMCLKYFIGQGYRVQSSTIDIDIISRDTGLNLVKN